MGYYRVNVDRVVVVDICRGGWCYIAVVMSHIG